MRNKIIEYANQKEEICRKNDNISPRLYEEYGVNRGLRDENGNGVLRTYKYFQNRLFTSCRWKKNAM